MKYFAIAVGLILLCFTTNTYARVLQRPDFKQEVTITTDSTGHVILEGMEWDTANYYRQTLFTHAISKDTLYLYNANTVLWAINTPIDVYPNPAVDDITIDIKRFNPMLNLVMYNAVGQTVLTDGITTAKTNILIGNLNRGLYFIKVADSYGNNYVFKEMVMGR